jgi:hypothetical protein
MGVLNAQMTATELLDAAKSSARYYDDADFHLLTDWVDRLWVSADRRMAVDAVRVALLHASPSMSKRELAELVVDVALHPGEPE